MNSLISHCALLIAPGAVEGEAVQVHRAAEPARGTGRHLAVQLRSVAAAAQGKCPNFCTVRTAHNGYIYAVHRRVHQVACADFGFDGETVGSSAGAQVSAAGGSGCGAEEVRPDACRCAKRHRDRHRLG